MNEKVARALCFSEDGEECCASPEECWDWDADTDRAHRVIEALTAQGLAIVPLEPTEEMINSVGGSPFAMPRELWQQEAVALYRAMLAANK